MHFIISDNVNCKRTPKLGANFKLIFTFYKVIFYQVWTFEYLERLWMEVEDTDLLQGDDGPDGLEAGAVVRLLVLAVLNKSASQNILEMNCWETFCLIKFQMFLVVPS